MNKKKGEEEKEKQPQGKRQEGERRAGQGEQSKVRDKARGRGSLAKGASPSTVNKFNKATVTAGG